MSTSQQRTERTRQFLLKLPRVAETLQWRGKLVYWTLDRAVGGKIFAILPAEPDERLVLAFAAGPVRMPQLLELDGVRPAPNLARAHWVALEDWEVFSTAELETELRAAYAYVSNRMPPRVQRLQQLALREYRQIVRERKALPAKQ